ncbi:Lrp/AsnC family transcriptional regulator [Sulfolobus acidocaldarius]|uniref:Lrp/AsnC family transcriptional regulator n=1 Tax=Sulfolobus acidocaldarius TaxID=2285 RepID=UPI0011BDEF12|nr:Lrp/AsnC ligand binding domain-containing protein [Sulfolobus acidocaldarius]
MASAIVLINTDAGGEEEVFEKLKSLNEVTEVHIVYGVYDIVAKIEADTLDKLKDFVTNTVRKLPRVRSTLIMIVVEGKSLVKK